MRQKYGITHLLGPSIELTTMIGCPLKCTFCPQDNLKSKYGKKDKYLSLKNLIQILNKIPKNTRIDFSGMAEPWANPNCTEMLEKVLTSGFNIAIYTTLYGMDDYEKVKNILEQFSAQIEAVVLHLPDANSNMRGWKYSDKWINALKTIASADIACGIQAMTMDGSGRVHPVLESIVGKLDAWTGHTRADSLNTQQIKEQAIRKSPLNDFSLTCASSPFYDRNVLLPNCDLVLCCMDYNLKHIIGNLLTQSYIEIFQSSKLQDIIKTNEKLGFTKCSICKSCDNVKPIYK